MRRLVVPATLLLAACGGNHPDVAWGVKDGQPWCSEPCLETDGMVDGTGTPWHMCAWTCGNWKGAEDRYIEMIFWRREDGAWEPAWGAPFVFDPDPRRGGLAPICS